MSCKLTSVDSKNADSGPRILIVLKRGPCGSAGPHFESARSCFSVCTNRKGAAELRKLKEFESPACCSESLPTCLGVL